MSQASAEATSEALTRVRQWLDDYTPGRAVEPKRLADILSASPANPEQEHERLFALGWLHWLNDEVAVAEPYLSQALQVTYDPNALAEAAYWFTRVRLLQGHGAAMADYESVLRSLGGSPRATVWFVDLLGRAGRVERAEQVWKSVRGNRRLAGCDEGPLIEARFLLRRGELTRAERLLGEARSKSGPLWVEHLLLLAWIAASQKQADKARHLLQQARGGPYPASALHNWTTRLEERLSGITPDAENIEHVPLPLRDFVQGQQARRQGRIDEAITHYRAARESPLAQPFARYALACLGQEDMSTLLAGQPGLFLAVRCRVRLMNERFRRREASPAELLAALEHAASAGYQDATTEHFRRLATALQQPHADTTIVRELAGAPNTEATARNAFRAALELAMRHLPAAQARELLLEWTQRGDLTEELRSLVQSQLLCLELLEPTETSEVALALRSPAADLWAAAEALASQTATSTDWRAEVRALRSHPRWKGLAQSLLLQEAAQRGDVAEVRTLLEDVDGWRGLRTPPTFVVRALESFLAAYPGHPGWRRSLARWLTLWDLSALGPSGAILATHAEFVPPCAATAQPPPGVPAVAWLLYQAARLLSRADYSEALAFVHRALALEPDLASIPQASVVRDALPQLERHAQAQGLARALQPGEETDFPPAGVLTDAVQALAELPEGKTALDALSADDFATARTRLETLSERPDLPPRLAHHLALLMQRAAQSYEEREQAALAESSWRRAWRCWLRFLSATPPDDAARRLVLDWLLELHRHRLNALLARNAVDDARRYANLVRNLPAQASALDETLGNDLTQRSERFWDELATEYLLTTREAMRYGSIPEGWRGDYEKGLTYLRRLLSLDRDNHRLLAALVAICNDWLLDLFYLHDFATLRTQLERFNPFALQLSRRIDERPGDLTARAALANFWMFRGFLAADREQKAALYREALHFNPANHNVRELLADLGV